MAVTTRRTAKTWRSLALVALLQSVAWLGCAKLPAHLQTPRRLDRGVVLVLPGVEGRSAWNVNIALGLDQGGVTSAIRIHDWTNGVPGGYLANLTNLERNRQQAQAIAQWIREYNRENPGRPVHLVGHSGGAALAVMALEALPEHQAVEAVILLAPTLSPEYDLSAALKRVARHMYSFSSEKDMTALKIGTSIFGSVDREFGEAAGRVGFKHPPQWSDQTRDLYHAHLRQIRWTRQLAEYGANGSHLGWASRRFAQDYLAPIIRQNEARRPVMSPAQGNS